MLKLRLLKWDTQNGAKKIISKQISSSYSAKKVKKRSKLYSIDLLADEDQVLYVGDRLKKANRTYSSYSVIQWYSVILLSKCDWASWATCCHENRAHRGRDASITNSNCVILDATFYRNSPIVNLLQLLFHTRP